MSHIGTHALDHGQESDGCGIAAPSTVGQVLTSHRLLANAGRRMTGSEFEATYRKLMAGLARGGLNVGCIACDGCEHCAESTFCARSKGLARCHYCSACSDCTDCSHCTRCSSCRSCQHCVESERCTASAYLVRSTACIGCAYCFGCVGLARRDFHILNEPYDRATYFEVTARLLRELRIELP